MNRIITTFLLSIGLSDFSYAADVGQRPVPYPSMWGDKCSKFLDAFEKNKEKIALSSNNLGPFKSISDLDYSAYIGFLEGSLTSYNKYSKKPIYNNSIGRDSISLRFMYNYCSSHPYSYITDAIDALIQELVSHPDI
ncbi:hypothetical protein [Acetobacter malorum]|uniref:hypothetical protein n=1 Tax=Acetobacter malorum TaxID=178901 RepID=UPI000B06CAC3|nr:hypothetical protein [Acetobacter malorum]